MWKKILGYREDLLFKTYPERKLFALKHFIFHSWFSRIFFIPYMMYERYKFNLWLGYADKHNMTVTITKNYIKENTKPVLNTLKSEIAYLYESIL